MHGQDIMQRDLWSMYVLMHVEVCKHGARWVFNCQPIEKGWMTKLVIQPIK